ncbi:unnamed protein product, partial [Durusdinium trenchii]
HCRSAAGGIHDFVVKKGVESVEDCAALCFAADKECEGFNFQAAISFCDLLFEDGTLTTGDYDTVYSQYSGDGVVAQYDAFSGVYCYRNDFLPSQAPTSSPTAAPTDCESQVILANDRSYVGRGRRGSAGALWLQGVDIMDEIITDLPVSSSVEVALVQVQVKSAAFMVPFNDPRSTSKSDLRHVISALKGNQGRGGFNNRASGFATLFTTLAGTMDSAQSNKVIVLISDGAHKSKSHLRKTRKALGRLRRNSQPPKVVCVLMNASKRHRMMSLCDEVIQAKRQTATQVASQVSALICPLP